MALTGATAPASTRRPPQGYATLSTRPLYVLVFLLPLVIAYELGLSIYLSDPRLGAGDISARAILRNLFDAFGSASLHVPAILLVVVLFAWHVISNDQWKLKFSVLAGMLLESVLWAIPLLILGLLIAPSHSAASLSIPVPQETITALPWQAKCAISIGAGLYEELFFRLVLITVIHFLLVDVLRFSHIVGIIIAAAVSAIAFALYHNAAGSQNLRLTTFYCLAGLYFAIIFGLRGFGIVVAAHAMFDLIVLLAPAANSPQ